MSYALNDRPGVSDATRARIRAIAVEMGFQPSAAARALSVSRAGAVGLAIARPAGLLGVEMFSLQLVSGIEAVLGASSVSLLTRVADDPEAEAETYRAWSARHSVDGVFPYRPLGGRPSDPVGALTGAPGRPHRG